MLASVIHYLIFISLAFTSAQTQAECLGCVTPYVEHYPNGAVQESYIKKCLAKQKDIEGKNCEFCHCLKTSHSINRHPYKVHNKKKLIERPIETLTPRQTPTNTLRQKRKKATVSQLSPLKSLLSAQNRLCTGSC